MELIDIIVGFDYDCSTNLIEREDLDKYEKIIGIKFGPMLKNYILNYGYIGLNNIEFYGINNNQKEQSDLIIQTIYLHNTFNITKDYIAFENMGEGLYILIDDRDMLYKFISETSELLALNINLYEHISNRFNDSV